MASAYKTPSSKPAESELELYTIPSYSSWFSWDDIHETERIALKEFFDGSSISRTPKVYKEYRDFIINKYREDPSRRLTFTEIRKSLVGDASLLRKVFVFLEKWGLINFSGPKESFEENGERYNVRVEEGPPAGVRVVAAPNSLKPIAVPKSGGSVGWGEGKGRVKLPPLASYSDVFGEVMKPKELVCGVCGGSCGAQSYECPKVDFRICTKCFKDGNYGENNSVDDFKLKDTSNSSVEGGDAWTEAEILLLLESVLKHGDDWDIVAQNVKTKTKLDCISKLLELPFGQMVVGLADPKTTSTRLPGSTSSNGQAQLSSSEYQQTTETEVKKYEQENKGEQPRDVSNESPPMKRSRITSLSDAGSSLMQQVTHISTIVSPHITAAAAEAAVTALCSESSCSREIFDGRDISKGLSSSAQNSEPERVPEVGDSEMMQRSAPAETTGISQKKDDIPLPLQIRAAVATALGAAAAHAKLLADQEEREMQHLVATIIEAEMKKLNNKIKHFEDLERIMDKEHTEMEKQKESLLSERIHVLQRIFRAGISRWRDQTYAKSQIGGIFSGN